MNHWDLRMFPWDQTMPRFYPPGQHPAMTLYYSTLRNLEELAEYSTCPAVEEQIAYCQEQIAAFEERESELKLEAYLYGR